MRKHKDDKPRETDYGRRIRERVIQAIREIDFRMKEIKEIVGYDEGRDVPGQGSERGTS